MRLVGWPSTWNPAEGLLPIETQEIDFHASAEELHALAMFFMEAAGKAAQGEGFERVVEFPDSKGKETTPICITVHHGKQQF